SADGAASARGRGACAGALGGVRARRRVTAPVDKRAPAVTSLTPPGDRLWRNSAISRLTASGADVALIIDREFEGRSRSALRGAACRRRLRVCGRAEGLR